MIYIVTTEKILIGLTARICICFVMHRNIHFAMRNNLLEIKTEYEMAITLLININYRHNCTNTNNHNFQMTMGSLIEPCY